MKTEDPRKPISHHINFDTYEVVKRLCASGMPEKQAEEVMHAIILSKEFDLSQLSTREQIVILQKEMEKYSTRDQVDALQKDIQSSISAIQKEILHMQKDMLERIDQTKYDTIKWIAGMFITLIITIIIRPYIG